MDKPSSELVARFNVLAGSVPAADRKVVFGSPTCLVGGNMFLGTHAAGVFVRLPTGAAAELLAAGGTAFEPMPGRPMNEFFVLPASLEDPERWVRQSYDYATSLPAKQPKRPKQPPKR